MSFVNDGNNLADKIEDKIGEHIPPIHLGDYWEVEGYNVSNLVMWFSNLTRYGTNFKKLDNATLLNQDDYIQAVSMYAAMAGIVAIALSVFLVIFCCCNCMFRSAAPRTPKYKGQRGSRGSFFCGAVVLLVAILGAATFVVGIIGETRLNTGAENVCTTVNNVERTAKQILNDTRNAMKGISMYFDI